MNFRRQQTRSESAFQLAPMVDILFILLIFFIVTYAFQQIERDMRIGLPATEEAGQVDLTIRDIIINISREGKIIVTGRELSLTKLKELLARAVNTLKAQSILIRADKKTFHGDVVRVMDVCAGLNINKISFITIQKESSEGG
ncbi:MAG: ExbD/TolR family protein [Candidatus Brocadiales bacterium]